MKLNNILISTALLMGLATTAHARPRTAAEQMQAASQAINAQLAAMHKAPRKGLPQQLASHGNLNVMGYAEGGYAIVTTDDLLPAVVGYSTKTFDSQQASDGFQWWLDAMTEAAAYYVQNGIQARVVRPNTDKVQPYVRPLLSTEWGQEEPFNNACPVVLDDELYPRHSVVGCVATATAQILNYYKWPANGTGTTSLTVPYDDPTGQRYTIDFSKCSFDWQNMRNTYTQGNYTDAEARAVSELSHAMGMMAQMQYGFDFSGAMSEDARDGLQNFFGISSATYYARTDIFGFTEKYSIEEWSNMIFQELSSMRPLYYAGADANDLGGHAFVFDGYDADGLVHVNWGWHGRFDGYYDISILDPRIYHFSKQQEMILGICPPERAKGLTELFSVAEPGELASDIEAVLSALGGAVEISAVKVDGPLNADDLHALATMPALTSIDLSSATLPGDLLPPYAFYGCTNLRTLLLPQTMRFYGDGALAGCSNLNRLDVPEGDGQGYVQQNGVLYSPDKTEVLAVLPTAPDTVTIAEGVTNVHAHAFEGCKYVRIVTLPRSLDVLGRRALADVLIMRELHVLGSLPAEADADVFSGADPGFIKLFIPAGSRAAYEQAQGWSQLFRSDNVAEVGTMVRARNLTRQYGEDVDEYYYEVLGERVKGLPQLVCAATKESPAGRYTIEVLKGTIESDDVELVNGVLTITGGPVGLNGGNSATADGQSTFNLGYCNGEVATTSQLGGQGDNHVSAAIYVPASMLSAMGGATVTSVRAGLATRLNIDELSVWVRSSLTGTDLATGKLNRKQTRVQQGWNEVSLDAPYTIPADCEGLYIGYTYHHTSLSRAVSIVGATPASTAFVKLGDDASWQDVSQQGAISIEAVVSGSGLAQYDLALQRASLTPAPADGLTAYRLTADVANMGTADVTGFDLSVMASGVSTVTAHVDETIASGRQQTVSLLFVADNAYAAEATVVVSSLVDGTDANLDNNEATAAVAFERNLLIEEFTTEPCPNCPAGAATMHAALQSKAALASRISVVCHHSAFGTDWLTQECDNAYTWFFNENGQAYAPAWMFDRQPEFESNIASGNRQAIYFTSDAKEFAATLEAAIQMPATAVVGAKATLAADGQLTVTVNGLRNDAFDAANACLTVYVTEDNIAARNQQGTSEAFVHQHVIRAYNSTWGDPVSWTSNSFSRTYTFTAAPDWKAADLKVVALLANYDAASNLNCVVQNSVTAPVLPAEANAIAERTATGRQSQVNYTLGGQRASASHRGFVVIRRADGSVVKQVRSSQH